MSRLGEAPDVGAGVSAGAVGFPVGADVDGRSVPDVGAVLDAVLVGTAVFGAGSSGCWVLDAGRTRM
jgi:hypothetical protein